MTMITTMAEVKDPSFKLFGKTIQLPNNLHSSTTCFSSQEMNKEDGLSPKTAVEVIDLATTLCENPKTPSSDKETYSPKASSNEEESETSPQQEKTLKKPDQIVPCPRCTSMDTKFCYYNNYNTNQPRHFCKNCQRYWTSGGATRNVPVGSGRRRNKNLCASHYNRIIISESQNCVESGGKKTGDEDRLSESSITGSNSCEKGQNGDLQEFGVNPLRGFSPQVPCFPGPPGTFGFFQTLPYWPWNMAWISPLPSSPNSPVLGKHSRDENIVRPSNSEKEEQEEASKDDNLERRRLYYPKTLRIDDPIEAAKSSIWSTLGIKNEPSNRGGLFNAFQAKGNEKSQISETPLVLQANPAALSRAFIFREIA